MIVTFTVEIQSGYDAVASRPEYEVARLLREVADKIQHGVRRAGPLYDSDGNRAGQFYFTN